MRNILLFDDAEVADELLPFTFTRPVSLITCGILTMADKWQHSLKGNYSFVATEALQEKYEPVYDSDNLYINGSVFPNPDLINRISELQAEEALYHQNGTLLAARSAVHWPDKNRKTKWVAVFFDGKAKQLRKIWHINEMNGVEIGSDLDLIRSARKFVPLTDPFTHCYNPENIFIEEGAVVKASVLNAEGGPIHISKNAVVQEGCLIQGPFSLGEGAILAQGTKIRPGTTIGHHGKAGGEIKNCVFFPYSNKGHDGYLGHSVIGEWCNLGANTLNSNLKNDYGNVRLFSHMRGRPEDTGLNMCGLYMGDYTKTGVNTMFNTGTVVGVSANVFGAGFQEKFIPSFTWGGLAEGYEPYRLEKALQVAALTQKSKNQSFSDADARLLTEIYQTTKKFR